jgi:hypothetical protein
MKPTILICLLIITEIVFAANDSDRTELLLLIKQRKELFDSYNESLNKKSGFLGNKTKNDLRDTQDKLLDVVNTDNKIMNSLSRTLDFRNFEKQSMSYDVSSFEQRIRNLSVLNDSLNTQYARIFDENKKMRSAIRRQELYTGLLFFLLLIAIIAWIRKNYFQRD